MAWDRTQYLISTYCTTEASMDRVKRTKVDLNTMCFGCAHCLFIRQNSFLKLQGQLASRFKRFTYWLPLVLIHHSTADIVCLFVLRFNVPVNNFSVMSGRSHCFLSITSTFRCKVSCSRTKPGGGRFRTPDLPLQSLTLYH